MVCVEKLDETPTMSGTVQKWSSFLQTLERTASLTAGAERLFENVWLFPVQSGVRQLGPFLAACTGLQYKVYTLADKPALCV
jgi:hypothetical protein